MDDKIRSILEAAALDGCPVIDELTSDIWPCITFECYSEKGSLFGGGKAEVETSSYQVDIWYQVKEVFIKSVIESVWSALKSQPTFSYPVKEYSYDKENNMHHTYFTFDVIKESEV